MVCHPHVKINLGLSVLRRRPDGYHDLETLFVPYHGISDTLEIITGEDWSETSASLFERYSPSEVAQAIAADGSLMITITRRGGVDWDPLSDLTARAYSLLAADYKLPPMKIFLEKTAPVGAGLGGGSSDAAFALRMISEIAGLGLDDDALASYAARLGSDCAFFVYDRPMLGEGRGEVLTPLDVDFGNCELRVVVPADIAVSTAEAYRGIVPREVAVATAVPASAGENLHPSENARLSETSDCKPLREALALPMERWRGALVNDFEATVFAAHPELAALKQQLYDDGAIYASMSGSGSALFGLFPSQI